MDADGDDREALLSLNMPLRPFSDAEVESLRHSRL